MNSPTTPKANFTFETSEPKITWHPLAKSAGIGWMKRTDDIYLDMYFDIREKVLHDIRKTWKEIDYLVLRRLIPRPLPYPSMEKLKGPPPDGFRRISMRYNMTNNPEPFENNEEDIKPSLRNIRKHLKRLEDYDMPFRPFELQDPNLFHHAVVLKFDFYPPLPESCASLETVGVTEMSLSRVLDAGFPDLSDCSSFVE